MADSAMVKDASADDLAKAADGKISFFSKEAIKPLVVAGATGGIAVVTARYFLKDKFFPEGVTEESGLSAEQKTTRQYYIGGAKVVIGGVGAMALKRVSTAAALGFAVALVCDGVADIATESLTTKLDDWFGDETASAGPAENVTYFQEVQRRRRAA
jgi:hypothetical protein